MDSGNLLALPRQLLHSIVDTRSLYARAEDQGAGSAQDDQGIGIVSFLTAFSVALIIFAVQITLFLLLRNKLARIL